MDYQLRGECQINFAWNDYSSKYVEKIEAFLDKEAIKYTSCEGGFNNFYTYWCDELPKTTIHSSYLVRNVKFETSKVYSGFECNYVKREIYYIQNNELYNNVRSEQWFKDIIEKYTPFAKDNK